MKRRSFSQQLDIDLLHLRYRLKRDWQKSGPWIKRSFSAMLAAFFCLFLFLHTPGVWLESILLHQLFAWRGPREMPKSVTIVRIDERTYKRARLDPTQILPRNYLAKAVNEISAAGASLIVLDLVLPRKGQDELTDRELAMALEQSPSAIGYYTEIESQIRPNGQVQTVVTQNKSNELFSKSAKAVFSVDLLTSNGVVERICLPQELSYSAGANVPLLKLLRKFTAHELEEPGERDFINFYGKSSFLTNLSLSELLDSRHKPEAAYFKNRIVFIGVFSKLNKGLAKADVFRTPTSNQMFGVEIHATIAANLLDRSWIRRFPAESEIVCLGLVAFILAFFVLSGSLFSSSIIGAAFSVFGLGFSYLVFSRYHYFIPCATLLVIVVPLLVIVRLCLEQYYSMKRNQIFNNFSC